MHSRFVISGRRNLKTNHTIPFFHPVLIPRPMPAFPAFVPATVTVTVTATATATVMGTRTGTRPASVSLQWLSLYRRGDGQPAFSTGTRTRTSSSLSTSLNTSSRSRVAFHTVQSPRAPFSTFSSPSPRSNPRPSTWSSTRPGSCVEWGKSGCPSVLSLRPSSSSSSSTFSSSSSSGGLRYGYGYGYGYGDGMARQARHASSESGGRGTGRPPTALFFPGMYGAVTRLFLLFLFSTGCWLCGIRCSLRIRLRGCGGHGFFWLDVCGVMSPTPPFPFRYTAMFLSLTSSRSPRYIMSFISPLPVTRAPPLFYHSYPLVPLSSPAISCY